MKITLAYPYKGHKPDETVDLPDVEARRLLSDGAARRLNSAGAAAGRKLAEELTTAAPEPTPTTRPRHNRGASRTKEK